MRLRAAQLCAVLVLAGCSTSGPVPSPTQTGKDPQVDQLKSCLVGHWMHSQEEDTAQASVYRPASYAFPPARGRTGYQFYPDGRATYYGIAAADGSAKSAGTWIAEGSDTVRITVAGSQQVVWQVTSCSQDRLTVER